MKRTKIEQLLVAIAWTGLGRTHVGSQLFQKATKDRKTVGRKEELKKYKQIKYT